MSVYFPELSDDQVSIALQESFGGLENMMDIAESALSHREKLLLETIQRIKQSIVDDWAALHFVADHAEEDTAEKIRLISEGGFVLVGGGIVWGVSK